MSQLDCQPPTFDLCVLGWVFIRSSMTRRSSALSTAASGTSNTTSGVANNGTISGTLFIRGRQPIPRPCPGAVQTSHDGLMAARVTCRWDAPDGVHEVVRLSL